MDFSTIEKNAMEFVNIPSSTGNEGEFAEYLAKALEHNGWYVLRQPIPNQPQRFNVVATREKLTSDNKVRVLLNSHLDVVPPHIPAREDDHNIYGRGSNETKGQIAAMLSAVQDVGETRPDLLSQIGFLFVVGEEVDHIGMQTANALEELKPEFLIVGEPTELSFAAIQKGALKVQIRTCGIAGHSGYPASGTSAVHKLIPILNDIMNHQWPNDERLGATTFNIGLIKGGQAQNAWAAEASANIFFRVTTSVAHILGELKKIVGDVGEIEVLSSNELVEILRDEPPLPLKTSQIAFNTDIAYYHRLNQLKGAYLLGAGSITNAFSEKEFIPKKELHEYKTLLTQLIMKLLQ